MSARPITQRHRETAADRPQGYRWVILGLGILAYATSLFARQNYTGVQNFVALDLHLDKAALGLLGSVFFYTYAVFQLPWGILADKIGSRWVTGAGILMTAGTMAGFATSESHSAVFFWRAASGIGGAAAYVAMSGGVAYWFSAKERGLSQTALGGVGGGLGECTAFFLMPVLAVYFASGWRQGMFMVAGAIAVIGILCLLGLRSAPERRTLIKAPRFDWSLLRDPRLWVYTFLFSAFIVGLRGTQTWFAAYAADVFVARGGLSLNEAIVRGGLLVTIAYSVCGRSLGCPLAGKLSDVLTKRGVSRTTVSVVWLVFGIVLLQILASGGGSVVTVAIVAFLLGVSMNLFPLITAAISETFGAGKTGATVAFVNMIAQFSGASMLMLSGYVGIALSAQPGNSLAEYRGIWLSAMVSVAILTTLGILTQIALTRGRATVPAMHT